MGVCHLTKDYKHQLSIHPQVEELQKLYNCNANICGMRSRSKRLHG